MSQALHLALIIMEAWVYIIQSDSTDRYYCGQSTDVERRLRQHNDPDYRLSKTTKRFVGPWRPIWCQECKDRGYAMRLEKQIKKRGIGRFLREAQSAKSRRGGISH
jgi:putative endonuclease